MVQMREVMVRKRYGNDYSQSPLPHLSLRLTQKQQGL